MGYEKHLLKREPELVNLKVGEDEIQLKIKQLPWSLKQSIISRSTRFIDGAISFDGALYVKEALKYMIVEAPWGETNETFLVSIDDELGNALESLVPRADSGKRSTGDLKKE